MVLAVAEAAKEFVTGPRIWEAARRLLDRFPLAALCGALAEAATPEDAQHLLDALESLCEFEQCRGSFLTDPVLAGFLKKGAGHPSENVRKSIARLLARLAHDEVSIERLVDAGLLALCEQLIVDECTSTSEAAAKALSRASRFPKGRQAVFGGSVDCDDALVPRLYDRVSKLPDVQRIRLLAFFVELGRLADEDFAALEGIGAYKAVLDAFLTDDILLKLNGIELVDALGSFPTGQEYLSRNGVAHRLAAELPDPMNDDSVRVCLARLLSLVVHRVPDMCKDLLPGKDSPLAVTIAHFLDSKDVTQRLCGLNAWANISSTPAGLAFFLSWPEVTKEVVSLMSATSQQGVDKVAMAAWTSVLDSHPWPETGIMEVDDGAPGTLQLWELAEQQVLPLALKNLVLKAFPEVRVFTWKLLAAMVRSRSMTQKQLTSTEMRDTLFDFSSESQAEARISKYEFVTALLKYQGQWLGGFLDENLDAVLLEYSQKGPHWMPAGQAAVRVGDTGA
eukprot:TRINITY_DN18869_c0_g1_i1.p1 TRINITY_DN18869_c0_g1~~TRINITY_DN18869_c0_g1_i1.p1  ORF type:complete len:507 (-),score=124.23 TRINITY_DN18869_c0_g1_i1:393-1913(-)